MNKDQVKGSTEQAKGKVKELAGKIVGNTRLEAEGDAQQIAGKARKTYGNVKAEIKKSK